MGKIRVGKRRKPMMVTHKDEKTRELQSRLKWLLDFLNRDIDSIKVIDCLKLHIDFQAFIRGWSPSTELYKWLLVPESDSTQERQFLKESRVELRGILEEILLPEKQTEQETDETFLPGIDKYTISYMVVVKKDRVFKERMFRKVPGGEIGERRVASMDTGTLADALIDVISLFPLSRIRRCEKPGCGNYFYQKTTKSKGDFCSRKCQNWANTNRWRGNHRPEYNAYHRAYHSNQRDKARQDQVEVKCFSCEFRESKGLLGDYLKSYCGPQDCPRCKKTKLSHIVNRWDRDEKDWVGEDYTVIEWNDYLRKIQKGEGSQ